MKETKGEKKNGYQEWCICCADMEPIALIVIKIVDVNQPEEAGWCL